MFAKYAVVRRGAASPSLAPPSGARDSPDHPPSVPVVRRAREDDYEAVMDIDRDVYEGNDYLPALYHTYFHSQRYAVYTVEQDGLLV